MFIWHRRTNKFTGETIYPLNQLRELHPELAMHAQQKYVGREFLLEKRIEPLNCLWNDVIHLSPMHPQKAYAKLRELGMSIPETNFFEIPVASLDPRNAILLKTHNRPTPVIDATDFLEFNIKNLEQQTEFPQVTLEHYKDFLAKGRSPFVFVGIVHVLYRGPISVVGVNIIKI
jgi:hypothetical protein